MRSVSFIFEPIPAWYQHQAEKSENPNDINWLRMQIIPVASDQPAQICITLAHSSRVRAVHKRMRSR